MSSPTVSILIVTSDDHAALAATLGSLRAQTLTDWEAVLISAGQDRAVAPLLRTEPRIRLVDTPCNGPAAARNAGLDVARGEFIAFLNAGDTLDPCAFASLVEAARSAPHRAALGSWSMPEEPGPAASPLDSRLNAAAFGLDALLQGECPPMQAQLIHRETLAGLRFDDQAPGLANLGFFGPLAARGVEWAITGAPICTRRTARPDRASAALIRDFQDHLALLRGMLGQAREAGLGSDIDLTPAREAGLLHQAALRSAHRSLLDDPSPRKDLAAEIFSSVRSTLAITPNLAARAMHDFQLLDGLDSADMPRQLRRYAAALAPWWRRCTAEGWAGPGFEPAARRALARELASMQDFSAALLNRCGASRELIILGFGRNGRRLARELARRGLPVTVRDDGLTADEARARAGNIAITFIDRDQPYDPEPLYLLSVLSDEAYLQRLPRGLDLVRWADHFRHFADDTLARLIRAWPTETVQPARLAA